MTRDRESKVGRFMDTASDAVHWLLLSAECLIIVFTVLSSVDMIMCTSTDNTEAQND